MDDIWLIGGMLLFLFLFIVRFPENKILSIYDNFNENVEICKTSKVKEKKITQNGDNFEYNIILKNGIILKNKRLYQKVNVGENCSNVK